MKLKKVFAFVLIAVLAGLVCIHAFAGTPAEDARLRFRKDGGFTILNFSDIQDDAVLASATKLFIRKSVKELDPDLIVLTGDNIAGYSTKTKTLTLAAIKQYMDIFESLGVPVAMVYGNHDDDGTSISKEEEMAFYARYKVNLACDDGDLYGCGTYNVPILGSSSDQVKFNLYMIDSGSYDTEHDGGGYDYVHPDQIQWYKDTSLRLASENGGSVPSIAFQHIVPPEIYDALEVTQPGDGAVEHGGKYYKLPETARPGSILGESPCPGNYNAGQFDAFVQGGDVLAVIVGHDHVNSFVVPYKGVDIATTPTCGFHSYGNADTRGVRVIRLNENDPTHYETEVILLRDMMEDDGLANFIVKLYDFFDRIGDFFERIGDSIEAMFKK